VVDKASDLNGANGKHKFLPNVPGIHVALPNLDEPVIVLTGARSGSTLVRRILDAHPDLACPPETNILKLCASLGSIWELTSPDTSATGLSEVASANIRATVDAVFSAYLLQRGKRRWCEKSLGSVHAVEPFLCLYPKVRFICLYRHCMDMIDSALEATPWGLTGYGFDEYAARFPSNSILALAGYWCELTGRELDFEEQHQDKCYRVYYEELVTEPERVCKEMFSFIGAEYDSGIIDRCLAGEQGEPGPGDHKILATSRISRDSVGRGTRIPVGQVPPAQMEVINAILGRLGYAQVDEEWANCAVRPAVLHGRSATARVDATPEQATAEVLERLDQIFQARVAPRLAMPVPAGLSRASGQAKRMAIIAYCDAGAQGSRYWEFGSGDTEIRTGMYAGFDDLTADWLLTGDASTWSAVIAGERNLATCIKSRDLRYITFEAVEDRDQHSGVYQQLWNERISLISYLLDQHGRPDPTTHDADAHALARVPS
jgi:hypothetical protein